MLLRDLGEFNLIESIRQQVTIGANVIRGIGDDTAVLSVPVKHSLLTSTDMLVEGIHFHHAWTSPRQLGRKAVAVNLSDIAAMGGQPKFLYLGLACPENADVNMVRDFMDGVLTETGKYGVCLAGGDTCCSPGPWIISVTVEGIVKSGGEILRDGAEPGDRIMVSGTLGDSALALHQLMSGGELDPHLAKRHHTPTARIELGRQLSEQGLAKAMIDISDGLTSDLEHILHASGVDGCIIEERLPYSVPFQKLINQNDQLLEEARFGGEDYELLFTVAPENLEQTIELGNKLNLPVTEIGRIQEGSGNIILCNEAGEIRPDFVRGYDHFSHS